MASREQKFEAQPLAASFGRVFLAPIQWVVTGEEYLRFISSNSAPGVTLSCTARVIGPEITPQANKWPHTPNADRSIVTTDFWPGIGAILNVGVFVNNGTPTSGQCWVICQLVRGQGAAATPLATLFAGAVTATQGLGYPGSAIVPSTQIEPVIRIITGTQPAVNQPIVETVPTGARWELIAFGAQLTGAPSINIIPNFQLDGGGNAYFIVRTLIQTAWNLTVARFWFGEGQSVVVPTAAQSDLTHCIPTKAILQAGSRIQLSNAGPNNQYSAPLYVVREWPEVN